MRIVMTLMVRDEADVVEQMIEHSLSQGVDLVVATDNGSVDGTTEVLERYARDGLVDLRHDPVHRKQQGERVTHMARDAATVHGADWVINADADEFWVPVDRSITLRDALSATPVSLRSFLVPVIDMTGPPAMAGTGLSRLTLRDRRPLEAIRRVGLHAHSSSDAVHVGDPDVVVVQGNHLTSIASAGSPPAGAELEVLHLPWRSWSQFRRKVENAGRGYEANPDLTPSPNHHGMRDWRRLQSGTLLGWYLARHPDAGEIDAGLADGTFVEDLSLVHLADTVPDEPVDSFAPTLRAHALEAGVAQADASALREALATTAAELAAAQADAATLRGRKIFRAIGRVSSALRR